MPTKKTTKTKKIKKCECKDCNCKCTPHSQIPFYILIALLVATGTVLVVSLTFNKSVRELFKPANYMYSGRFENESKGDNKDENNIKVLSAGAVIDMVASNNSGFVIVGEENCLGCDAFARRVAKIAEKLDNIYRYNASSEEITSDDLTAKKSLGVKDNELDFVYIKEGLVYDRIDDVKDEEDLAIFLKKYN